MVACMLPVIIRTGLLGGRVGYLSLEDSVFLAKAVSPFQSGISQSGFAQLTKKTPWPILWLKAETKSLRTGGP